MTTTSSTSATAALLTAERSILKVEDRSSWIPRSFSFEAMSKSLMKWRPWVISSTLVLIMVMAFSIRLYSVVRFESVIHEFDPWFNFRATQYLVDHGPSAFFRWFDDKVWWPMGRHVGRTVYPGMIFVTGSLHYLLNRLLAFPVDLRNICVFLGPVCSALTCLAAYWITQEVYGAQKCQHLHGSSASTLKSSTVNQVAGLFAAAFTAIIPGYISRSVAGSYDYEAIAIWQMLTTFGVWLRAVRTGSAAWAIAAAACYFFMASSWGGYVFIINVVPLHSIAMCVLNPGLVKAVYRCFCSFYVIALLSAMTVPFVSHQPIDTSEHMLAMATFVVLHGLYLLDELHQLKLTASTKRTLAAFALGIASMAGLGIIWATNGRIVPWAGRFYSLWDTSYARKHIPIIASVSEHQPTTWSTFFLDMQLLMIFFPLGLCFILSDKWMTPGAVFAAIYGLSATYFASVMVRLILTLAPLVCICSGVAASRLLNSVPLSYSSSTSSSTSTAASSWGMVKWNRLLVNLPLFGVVALFLLHCVYVTHSAYSSPSIMLSSYDARTKKSHVIDDFREAFSWLRHNTPTESKVLAWWDYGYQLNGMADRTTIVDNNTWNNEHIALVGKIFASDEDKAWSLCKQLHVDYVLILFGGLTGFSGDDLNKFLWMVRIAQGVFPEEVRETDFYNAQGEYRMDDQGSAVLRRSLMYRLSYANLGEMLGPQMLDRVRRHAVSKQSARQPLKHFREVFSTENYLVRIYQVV